MCSLGKQDKDRVCIICEPASHASSYASHASHASQQASHASQYEITFLFLTQTTKLASVTK